MIRLLYVTILLPASLLAASGSVTLTLDYAPGDFEFRKANGFDVVLLPGQYSTSVPGEPNLPVVTCNVVIPADAEVTAVEIADVAVTRIPGEFRIHPCQHPHVLSRPMPAFVPPDLAAYSSEDEYPREMATCAGSGLAGGYRIAGLSVMPLRYVPARKELLLATRIEVVVRYERGRNPGSEAEQGQIDLWAGYVRSLVQNPHDVEQWQPQARMADDWLCDMMVITSTAMAGNVQPFADWKTRRGIKTVVVKTESIYGAFPGRDNPERIRNCIAEYWRSHGLKWVLLAGDDGIVPVRTARLTVEGNTEDIATDMYYADLQYSWDSNHNDLFGEMEDTVDFFHDVFVGRAPVDNAADVRNFFTKCTTYERRPDTAYIRRALYGSTMLFDPFHGRVINHIIADEFPTGWRHAHLEDPDYGAYADSMSRGFHLAHVAAHGNPSTFSVLEQFEVPGLSNGMTKLNFVNSIACQSGWFDGEECIAEELMNCTSGGCIALMLNSRYGFGYPPGFGPSEMLDLQFYRSYLAHSGTQFGTLAALCKDYYQGLSQGQEVWRWCVYELNLMGDPSLSVWSRVPRALTVTRPDSVLVGPQVVRVTVQDGATPIAGALVCLGKAGETYARGWTSSQGSVDLFVQPATTGNVALSASAQDYYPHEAQVPVRGSVSGPALVFAGLRIEDGGNGRLDPGETADLYFSVANAGSQTATGTTALLRTTCPWLTLLDSTAAYGDVAAGDTAEGDAYRVTASGQTPEGTPAELTAACSSAQGYWEAFTTTQVGEPPPARKLWADHDTGNMILSVTSVGSIGTLGPYREGSGLKYPRTAGYGSLYFASLACGNGADYVVDRWYGHPSSTFQTDWRVVDTLHPLLPPLVAYEEYQAVFDDGAHPTPKGLNVTQWSGALSGDGYDDFVVIEYTLRNRGTEPINGVYAGIFSDFDIDNTSDNKVYSDAGRRLVYMVQDSSEENSAGIKLLSPYSAANISAIDHAVYITPGGMLTEAVKDSFLRGSIHRANSNRTANWSCMVSAGPFDIVPGSRTDVVFAMVGGDSRTEVLVHADSAQSWYDRWLPSGVADHGRTFEAAQPGAGRSPSISPAYGRARLRFTLPTDGWARLGVYDAAGRVVRVLADRWFRRGVHTLNWDGRDERGIRAARGVYLYRLETNGGAVSRKSVVLR